jgi:YHS domain-containing protein
LIRAVVFAIELLFWLLVVRLLLRTVARFLNLSAPRSAPPRPRMRPAEDLVLDPVCHTHVPRSRALTANVDGREMHFCSADCRDKARAVARAS